MKLVNILKFSGVIFLMTICTSVFSQTPVQVDTLTSSTNNSMPATNATPTPQEDMVITNSIKSQIQNSTTLSKLNVNVQTNQGVVALSGNVDSDSQASSLIEIAQSVVGVQDVDASNLTIKSSSQPFADMMITAKAKGLFIREDIFGTKDIASINISVETKDGVVYLTGTVNNQQQIQNAIKIIQGIKGVKKVEYNVSKVMPNQTNGMPMQNGMQKTNGMQNQNGMQKTNGTTTPNQTQNSY